MDVAEDRQSQAADYRRRMAIATAEWAGGRDRALRVGVAAVAMVLVAEAAVWLLRPARSADPAGRRARERLLHAGADRARPHVTATASSGSSSPRWVPRAPCSSPSRSGGRRGPSPASSASARGPCSAPRWRAPALSVTLGVAALPASIAAHERAVDYGISTQAFGSWLGDVGKSAAIGAVLAAAGGGAVDRAGAPLRAAVGGFPGRSRWPRSPWSSSGSRRWCWRRSSTSSRRCRRQPGPRRGAGLARRAGVDVGQVYRVDASRRVRSLNAYVDGIGSDQAGRPLRQPAPPGQPPRAAQHRRPRARPRQARRRASGARLPDHRHAAGPAVRERARRRARRRTGVDRRGPGGAARLLPRARRRRARPRGARQPALAPGRGERRHLRPPAHPRPPRR